jgi:hypothetical protein
VSETEIEPMKTALSLMLPRSSRRRRWTKAAARAEAAGAGRLVLARLYPVGLPLHAVAGCCERNRETGQRHLPEGMDCVGLLLLEKWTRAALALALRFVFSVGGPIAVPRGSPPRRVRRPSRATSRRAAGRASGYPR